MQTRYDQAEAERKVPLDPLELANRTLDVALRLTTASVVDGAFALSPMGAIELAAGLVGAAFSEHVAMVANKAASDPGAAAELIKAVLGEAEEALNHLQQGAAERQAIIIADALGLTTP